MKIMIENRVANTERLRNAVLNYPFLYKYTSFNFKACRSLYKLYQKDPLLLLFK